jgi:LemA protein
MTTSTVIVLAVIVILIIWAVGVYNSLVSMRQRVNQAYADVDVQLRQRHDLIPNLVETVKGYAAHERGTLDEVVKARNAAMTAQDPAQQAAAENMLTGALRQLFALAEAYPDLKASTNFQLWRSGSSSSLICCRSSFAWRCRARANSSPTPDRWS